MSHCARFEQGATHEEARLLSRTVVVIAAALLSTPAFAQLPPITISTQPYVPLTGATVGTLVPRGTTFPANDEGFVSIPMAFTFPFLGTNYDTQVWADTNGFLFFGMAGCRVVLEPRDLPQRCRAQRPHRRPVGRLRNGWLVADSLRLGAR